MRKILLPTILIFLFGCGSDFEPELTGWTASTDTFKPTIYLNIDGRSKKLELSGGDSIGYHDAQWTNQDHLLLTQTVKRNNCYEQQIISMDTSGTVIDTVYQVSRKMAIDFKLAPNDSLIILKTCNWNCGNWDKDHDFNFQFTFYNRFSKKGLSDTIKVRNALNIILNETIWSPDSKMVVIEQWNGHNRTAFAFDLVTKDTTFIDSGSDFVWSPSDKDLVAYVKDYSVYSKNIRTGEKQLLYKGREKKKVKDFRWNPTGDFLMINVEGYFLGIESYITWNPTHVYLSMSDKKESKTFYNMEQIETWK